MSSRCECVAAGQASKPPIAAIKSRRLILDPPLTFVQQRGEVKRRCAISFYDLVGAGAQRQGDGEAEHLGGLEVEDKLKFCGLLERQIGRLFSLENAARIEAKPTIHIFQIGTEAHQAAARGEVAL